MKYQHVARYIAGTLWALDMDKWHELLSAFAYRAAGHEFTAAEIKARIGGGGGDMIPSQQGAVAVIPIRGVIANRMSGMDESSGGVSAERIGAMLSQVAADPNIKTILFDVDSPGGTVPGIAELAAQMFALRGQKRMIAHVNDMAASAAYWLASQADEIVSIPSGTVGSIGVFAAHEDLSAALEKEGIKVTLISAGKFKVSGNPFETLSDEERAVIQARVDEAYTQFTKDVARGRGVSPAAVRSGYGEGRALSAKDAKAVGLIDRIATMDETLARLVGRKSVGVMRADMSTITDGKMHSDHGINPIGAVVKVMVCDCSEDCPCEQGGVCGENCPSCKPGCGCTGQGMTEAEPMPMPAGAMDARRRWLL